MNSRDPCANDVANDTRESVDQGTNYPLDQKWNNENNAKQKILDALNEAQQVEGNPPTMEKTCRFRKQVTEKACQGKETRETDA